MRQRIRKFHRALTAYPAASLILWIACSGSGIAQDVRPQDLIPAPPGGLDAPLQPEGTPPGPTVPAPNSDAPGEAPPSTDSAGGEADIAADPTARPVTEAEMDRLFAELAEPSGEAWRRAQSDIERIWSRSGSSAMDLLYKRGEEALDAGDNPTAIGHLTALTDHAPDFAAGFYLRAVAYYVDGEFGPAIADLGTTLRLEPRHWGALTQLGAMLEEVGDDERALTAYRDSLKINPHQQEAADAVTRLEQKTAGTDA